MPRTNRGGPRSLPAGTVSATRTDMNARQPVRVGPSPVYGAGVALADAQRAVPLPQSTLPPATAPGAAPPAAPAAPPMDRPLPPGLTDPSRRPDQPLASAFGAPAAAAPDAMAQQDLGRLAAFLPALEVLASQPESTESMRNWVRTVRAASPTGA